jgi:hypothetical protein
LISSIVNPFFEVPDSKVWESRFVPAQLRQGGNLVPNAGSGDRSSANGERDTGKLVGSVELPKDVQLGFVARYQDGQPFARVLVVADLNQGGHART